MKDDAKKRRNFIWPSVDTRDGALWATKQGLWAAVFCAAVTAGLALLGVAQVQFARDFGMDVGALVDAFIFAAIAFGLWRQSRVAAWAGLLLYLAERIYMWSQYGLKNPVIAAILILAFIGGVRGTSALHAMNRQAQESPPEEDPARPEG